MSEPKLAAMAEELSTLQLVCTNNDIEIQRLNAEIERLRGQLLLEQDRVKTLREDCDHLREVVRLLNDDKHLDAWEGEG